MDREKRSEEQHRIEKVETEKQTTFTIHNATVEEICRVIHDLNFFQESGNNSFYHGAAAVEVVQGGTIYYMFFGQKGECTYPGTNKDVIIFVRAIHGRFSDFKKFDGLMAVSYIASSLPRYFQ